ncbi:MAG: hypothetical protein IT429_25065 [Gemmataceae bacterium]|nr:hypothetical protein [Gemmataceae bacterium]
MPLAVVCPFCARPFTAPDQAAGKKVKCPGCRQRLQLGGPAPKATPPLPPAKDHAPSPQPQAPAAPRARRGYPIWLRAPVIAAAALALLPAAYYLGRITAPPPAPPAEASAQEPQESVKPPEPKKPRLSENDPKVKEFKEKMAEFLREALTLNKLLKDGSSAENYKQQLGRVELALARVPEAAAEHREVTDLLADGSLQLVGFKADMRVAAEVQQLRGMGGGETAEVRRIQSRLDESTAETRKILEQMQKAVADL